MQNKKEERKTVFRRIGGKIVPIVVGGGAVYGSSKINSQAVTNEIFSSKVFKEKEVKTEEMFKKFKIIKKKYAKEILAEVGEEIHIPNSIFKSNPIEFRPWSKQNGFTYGSSERFTKDKPSGFSDFSKNDYDRWNEQRPRVVLGSPREAALVHELGHAQQYRLKTNLHKAMTSYDRGVVNNKIYKTLHRVYDKTGATAFMSKDWWSKKPSKLTTVLKSLSEKTLSFDRRLNGYMHDIKKVAYESDAWRRGLGMTKKGRKLKIIKQGIIPFSSYLVRPTIRTGKALLALSGISAITYGFLKRD